MQAPLQARNDSDAVQTKTAGTATQERRLVDNRPTAVAQRELSQMMSNSPRVLQQRALSNAIHNSPRMVAQRHEMNALFGGAVKPQDGAMPAETSPAQREEKTNNTGLPNKLKSGIESLSDMSMDHVKVHYNSDKPAQLQAHAYAQGSEIHLGAGQERHLPHEAWHVVQQAQGRVRPTLQMKAGAVNDDPSLEKEADMMGERAAQFEGVQPRVAGFVQQAQERVKPTLQLMGGTLVNDSMGLESEAAKSDNNAAIGMSGTLAMEGVTQLKGQGMRARIRAKMKNNEAMTEREIAKARSYGILGDYDWNLRAKINRNMNARVLPDPNVGISNRGGGGFINDAGVFHSARPGFKGQSLPGGVAPLPLKPSKDDILEQAADLRDRREIRPKTHLDGVDGVFIPGGQDRMAKFPVEMASRERYEMAIVAEARNRGMPMMAVCGGSRALARGYGAEEKPIAGSKDLDGKTISKNDAKVHKKNGPELMAHPIHLRDPRLRAPVQDPHTIISGAAPDNATRISKVNSTHEKMIAHVDGQIEPVNHLPAKEGESELVTSAWSPEGFPEGFETRYGAPVVGLTSHPESMHADPTTRGNAPPDARAWSDNLFAGFHQSMGAYRAKQAVNAEVLGPTGKARKANPASFEKWSSKRNWEKLLKLGMITAREAEKMKEEVAKHRQKKSDDWRAGVRSDSGYNRAERL